MRLHSALAAILLALTLISAALLAVALAGAALAQPAPPTLTVYGVPGGACATATGADTLTSDPPGRAVPGEALTLCWAQPPRSITATGPGGVAMWPSAAPTPLPTRPAPTSAPVELAPRQILFPVFKEGR